MLKSQGLCGGGVPLFLPKRWQNNNEDCNKIVEGFSFVILS